MSIIRTTWHQAKVLHQQQWTARLLSLRLQPDVMQPFQAGQFITLRLPVQRADGTTELVAKSYSLINAPHDPVVEVFYNIVPNGRLSTALSRLHAGDTVEMSLPPKGFFVLAEIPVAPELWMLATGTGLGPYLSILQTPEPWQRFRKLILVHGVALREELAYADLIAGFAAQYSEQFRFIACVSREPHSQGLTGRITTNFASGTLEQVAGTSITPANSHIMLCGNHNMLNDMKELLAERGLQRHLRHKPGHITTEQYF